MGYFFRYVQVIRNPFNAVVCCGASNLVLSLGEVPRTFRSVGSLVTNKDVNHPKQTLDLRFAWPFLTYFFLFVGVLILNYGLPLLDIRWSRSLFEGESLMFGWNLSNGILMFICLLACIVKPIRRQAERFPLGLVACLDVEGTEYWGITSDASEQGASRLRQHHLLGLNVEMPARETEAALIHRHCATATNTSGSAG